MGSVIPLERLFTLILSRARIALTYHEAESMLSRAPALMKIASLALAWVGLIATGLPQSLPLLAWVGLLALMAPRSLLPGALALSLIPTAFIGSASLLLTPHPPFTVEWALRSATLATRTLGLSLASLLVFATTSPLDLASLAARWPRLHDFIVVFYRSLPLTVGDVTEALAAQQSIGKLLHHTLVPATLMALRRAEGLSLSLYTRGYKLGPRTRITTEKSTLAGTIILATSLASLTLALLWPPTL